MSGWSLSSLNVAPIGDEARIDLNAGLLPRSLVPSKDLRIIGTASLERHVDVFGRPVSFWVGQSTSRPPVYVFPTPML